MPLSFLISGVVSIWVEISLREEPWVIFDPSRTLSNHAADRASACMSDDVADRHAGDQGSSRILRHGRVARSGDTQD